MGGTFANMWHFLDTEPDGTIGRYMRMYPETDIDLYIDAATNADYKDISVPFLHKFGGKIKQNTNYPAISYNIDAKDLNLIVDSIQLIAIRMGRPEDIATTFDMEHTKVTYDIGKNTLLISPDQLDLIKRKSIVYFEGKSKDPAARVKKWLDRGWTIDKTVSDPITVPFGDCNPFDSVL